MQPRDYRSLSGACWGGVQDVTAQTRHPGVFRVDAFQALTNPLLLLTPPGAPCAAAARAAASSAAPRPSSAAGWPPSSCRAARKLASAESVSPSAVWISPACTRGSSRPGCSSDARPYACSGCPHPTHACSGWRQWPSVDRLVEEPPARQEQESRRGIDRGVPSCQCIMGEETRWLRCTRKQSVCKAGQTRQERSADVTAPACSQRPPKTLNATHLQRGREAAKGLVRGRQPLPCGGVASARPQRALKSRHRPRRVARRQRGECTSAHGPGRRRLAGCNVRRQGCRPVGRAASFQQLAQRVAYAGRS
jgi:hypothetical protein